MAGPFYFAWAGTPLAPITLETTGDTNGAPAVTVSGIGDLAAGSATLTSVVWATTLSTGKLYGLAGDGIPGGALFVADGTATVEIINGSATATLANVTLAAIQAEVAAIVYGDIAPASVTVDNLVLSGALDPSVVYLAEAEGIPIGTTAEFAGSALTLSAPADFAATETPITLYAVAYGASSQITNVASLAGLVAGRRYMVAGDGIPSGAAFIAPTSGDVIELDAVPTSSIIGVPLQITGPIPEDEDFNPAVHLVEDLEIFSIDIEQKEGECAELTLEVTNPGVGLLAPGRKIWCWLSWDQNWPNTPEIVPLFNGRLQAIPSDLLGEVVTLKFIAKPPDFNQQKAELAASMRVLPYFDPVFIDAAGAAGSDDTVLEGYSAAWHVDRTDLTLTASDILAGEAGTILVTEDEHFYDGLDISIDQPPLLGLEVEATISYQQAGSGTVDLTEWLCRVVNGGPVLRGGEFIWTFDGASLQSSWPTPGSQISGGYAWSKDCEVKSAQPTPFPLMSKTVYFVDYLGNTDPTTGLPIPNAQPISYGSGYGGGSLIGTDRFSVLPVNVLRSSFHADFPISVFKIRSILEWTANRKRTETVRFVITADVQATVTDEASAEFEKLSLSSELVGQAVEADGAVPIGDLRRNSFFKTDRGGQSLRHLICLARARLLARARCIRLRFAMPWEFALPITTRHSVRLIDRRLPGGEATGKVVAYALRMSEAGAIGTIEIACTVGRGNTISPTAGEPVYSDGTWDAVGPGGYEATVGGTESAVTGDVVYEPLDGFQVFDDGLNLLNVAAEDLVISLSATGTFDQQNTATAQLAPVITTDLGTKWATGLSPDSPINKLAKLETKIDLVLKPIQGSEFSAEFAPAVSRLMVPRTVNLEVG